GTTGLGISLQNQFHPKLAVGISTHYVNFDKTFFTLLYNKITSIKTNTSSFHGELFLKWFPMGLNYFSDYDHNRFWIKAGVAMRSNPTYVGRTSLWESFQFGDFNFSPEEVGTINMEVFTQQFQPFISSGYTVIDSYRFHLGAEAGAFFHGTPNAKMSATGILHNNALNESQLQENVSGFKFFPLLRIEGGIKF
ncbi:MAG: hypothetical protein ACK43J_05165, partial [Chitinophagaceae bacterium]